MCCYSAAVFLSCCVAAFLPCCVVVLLFLCVVTSFRGVATLLWSCTVPLHRVIAPLYAPAPIYAATLCRHIGGYAYAFPVPERCITQPRLTIIAQLRSAALHVALSAV
jgi:hypothetical protein